MEPHLAAVHRFTVNVARTATLYAVDGADLPFAPIGTALSVDVSSELPAPTVGDVLVTWTPRLVSVADVASVPAQLGNVWRVTARTTHLVDIDVDITGRLDRTREQLRLDAHHLEQLRNIAGIAFERVA